MVALLIHHNGERLSQKNVSLCENITDSKKRLENRGDWEVPLPTNVSSLCGLDN